MPELRMSHGQVVRWEVVEAVLKQLNNRFLLKVLLVCKVEKDGAFPSQKDQDCSRGF